MYTTIDFKTKKALKEAVAAYNEAVAQMRALPFEPRNILTIGSVLNSKHGIAAETVHRLRVTYFQPNGDITGVVPPRDGTIYVEGPHYPKPHMWYAECTVKDGCIIKVK